MRRLPRIVMPLLVCGALTAAAAGCAEPAPSTSEHAGSALGLATEAGAGWDSDYTPLRSPADAVRRADLIVTGTLVGVGEGVTVQYRAGSATEPDAGYATYRVRVDRVISDRAQGHGDAEPAGDVLHVIMRVGARVTAERLAQLNPRARMVLVLADRTDWRPLPDATVIRPASIPATARLFAPYIDGVWLQGPADERMYGLGGEAADLAPSWGTARTVDQYAAHLRKAAEGR